MTNTKNEELIAEIKTYWDNEINSNQNISNKTYHLRQYEQYVFL